MIKKLSVIGIAVVVTVWAASSAMTASIISFTGGNITGTVTIQPRQSLQINDTTGITGTQSLVGDTTGAIKFETTKMSGYAFGDTNSYLKMTSVGSLSKGIKNQQSIIGIHGSDGRGASGIQGITGDISVGILNSIDITGMDFEAGQGCDPSLTIDSYTQTISLPDTNNKPEMKQASAFTFTVTAPGSMSDSLTLVPAEGRSGSALFMGVVATGIIAPSADLSTITYTPGSIKETQSFTSFLPSAVGSYTGSQESSKSIYLSHRVTIGRTE